MSETKTPPTEHEIAIEALFEERRHFPPPAAFVAQANVADPAVYERAAADPEAYWAAEAAHLEWTTPWQTTLE